MEINKLASGQNALAGVKACMDGYVARTNGAAGKRGCLVVASAMELAGQDREVSHRISQFFGAMEARLTKALRRAKEEGALAQNVSPAAAAHMLVCFLEGLRVVRKAGSEPNKAKAAIQALVVGLAA